MEDRALVLTAVRQLAFEDVTRAPLGPSEVRIRTLFSGISAGTELSQYRGTSPFMNRQWDDGHRVFRDAEDAERTFRSATSAMRKPARSSSGAGGEVFPGRRPVFGNWGTGPTRDERGRRCRQVDPGGADPRIGIFSHIGAVALNGVHDAASAGRPGRGVRPRRAGQIVLQAAGHQAPR